MKNIVDEFKDKQHNGDIDFENKNGIVSIDKDGNILMSNDAFLSFVLNKENKEILIKSFVSSLISNQINLNIDDLVINDKSINLDLLDKQFKKTTTINGGQVISGERNLSTTMLTYSYDKILGKNVFIRRNASTFFAYEKKLLPKAIPLTQVSNNIDDMTNEVKSRYDFISDNK